MTSFLTLPDVPCLISLSGHLPLVVLLISPHLTCRRLATTRSAHCLATTPCARCLAPTRSATTPTPYAHCLAPTRFAPRLASRRLAALAQIARAKEVKSHFLQKTAHEEHDARKAAEKAATGVIVSLGLVKEDEGK